MINAVSEQNKPLYKITESATEIKLRGPVLTENSASSPKMSSYSPSDSLRTSEGLGLIRKMKGCTTIKRKSSKFGFELQTALIFFHVQLHLNFKGLN